MVATTTGEGCKGLYRAMDILEFLPGIHAALVYVGIDHHQTKSNTGPSCNVRTWPAIPPQLY